MGWFPYGHGLEVFIPPDSTSDKYHSKQKCPICDRQFSTASGLLGHLDKYHTKEGGQ